MNPTEQKSYIYEAVVNKSTYKATYVGAGMVEISVKKPRCRKFAFLKYIDKTSDLDNEALKAKIVNVVKYHQLKLKYGRKSGDYSVLTAEQRAQFGITDESGDGFRVWVVPMFSMLAAERAVLDALAALDAAQ